MSHDEDGNGIDELFADPGPPAPAGAPAWTSSPWTLVGLVAVTCAAVSALALYVVPVAADFVLGWMPQFFQL